MFTGIITDIGTVKEARAQKGGVRLTIATGFNLSGVPLGASIACAGACLTVVAKGKGSFSADVSPETLSCTRIGEWKKGAEVNLERALKVGDELGGHIVTGHVDGLARIKRIAEEGESRRITLSASKKLMRFIAAKGSVTLDGVSLTVNKVKTGSFSVNIIPHTWRETTFRHAEEGQTVHLEVDLMARYAARLSESRRGK